MKVVIFDVDGTLLNGNCTYIFMRYLFEKKIIEPKDFAAFNDKFNKYCLTSNPYSEIISESIRTMSAAGIKQIKYHLKLCYDERIKMNFNQSIVAQLKEFQKNNLEIVLASGSHEELISLIGQQLDIKPENIIATISGRLYQENIPITSESICYGDIKMKRVIDLIISKNINLSEVIFFTDNVSDLNLLTSVGKGWWVGSNATYLEYSMSEKGIENFNTIGNISDSNSRVEFKLNKTLQYYYDKFSIIIEQSISEILPEECTIESMNNLVGSIELVWDLKTLQLSFFNPAYKYIHKKKQKIISLGSCILIGAAEIDLLKYIPLIGIGDLLEISSEMFLDIKEWTTEENIQYWNKSRIDNAMIGNVSIAMISLVTNNLIFNRIALDDDRKSALYESLTTVIFNSLFGNGLKLYWEQQKDIRITEEEYFKVAFFTNMAAIQIPCDLWRILRTEKLSFRAADSLNSFIENLSVAVQLKKDLSSFNLWQNNMPQVRTNKFNLFSNFIIINAAKYYNNRFVFTNGMPMENILEVIVKADSKQYTLLKSGEYITKAFASLQDLPIKSNYKELIKQYSTCLMNRT